MDSGADCSLIKLHLPDPEAPVYFDKKVILHGITPDGIPSLGRCAMKLHFGERSYGQEFQLVSSSFPLPYDGILGSDFLKGTGTVLDYGRNSIAVFGNITYPMNPSLHREPEPVVLSQMEKQIMDQRSVELSKLIRTDHLTNEPLEALQEITREYNDVFQLEGDPLAFTSVVEHVIETVPGTAPINIRPYRVAEGHRQEIERQVKGLADQGLIRRSFSPWNSPLLLVSKRSEDSSVKKWRLCVDFRKLNEVTTKIVTPIPRISDILERLGRSKWYSSLDMASGYWQILIREQDRCKTAFTAGNQSWEWNRLPFGLTTAPGTFVAMMRTVLDGVEHTMTYLDDIIVFTDTWEEHVATLETVFQRMRLHHLQLQPAKCKLLLSEVTYLGHRITKDGILIDPRNVEVVKNFPVPTTPKMVRSFLGFINYYRGFIKDCAQHALPLTELTRKTVKFRWTTECQKAMDYLVNVIIHPPVLKPPDFTKEFMLRTDASNDAMGAVLSQGEITLDHAVGYWSAKFNDAQKNYSTIEKEFLAIVRAIEFFRVFLLHRKFRLITDHNPLVYIRASVPQNSRLMRWRLSLEEYDFYIQHQPGKANETADYLSRLYESENTKATSVQTPELKNIRVMTRAQQKQIDAALAEVASPDTPTQGVIDEIVDRVTHLDPLSFSYGPYTELVNKVPVINHSVVEIEGKMPRLKSGMTVEFCGKDVLEPGPVTELEPIEDNEPRLLSVTSRGGGKVLVSNRENTYDQLRYEDMFESLKLLIRYCHANGIQELKMDLAPSVLKNLEYRMVLGILKFLLLNSDLKIKVFREVITTVEDRDRIPEILTEFHTSPLGGHQGRKRTLRKIQKKFWWSGMAQDVKTWVKECMLCQKVKHGGGVKQPMKVTSTASQPWERLAFDIVGPLPLSLQGNRYLLTAQDELTKYLFAIPIPDQTAETVARAMTNQILLVFGSPESILTDQGTNFLSEVFKNTCKFWKIKKLRTTAYHPQTNGGLERSHAVVKDYLRMFVNHDQNDWDEWVGPAVFTYNTSENAATKYTPFKLLFGWNPRIPGSLAREPEVVYNYTNYLADLKNKLQNAHAVAKQNLVDAKTASKAHYDKRTKTRRFEVNDRVWLSNKETAAGLDPGWQGPYVVLDVPSKENVVIQKGRKQVRVHTNRIKPCFGDADNVSG